jgi:hypothetical protein
MSAEFHQSSEFHQLYAEVFSTVQKHTRILKKIGIKL